MACETGHCKIQEICGGREMTFLGWLFPILIIGAHPLDVGLILERSWVNPQGRRYVYMNSDKARYEFTCNDGALLCVIPAVSDSYILTKSTYRMYKCNNVFLVNGHGEIEALYCLDAAVPKNPPN